MYTYLAAIASHYTIRSRLDSTYTWQPVSRLRFRDLRVKPALCPGTLQSLKPSKVDTLLSHIYHDTPRSCSSSPTHLSTTLGLPTI